MHVHVDRGTQTIINHLGACMYGSFAIRPDISVIIVNQH